MHQSGTLLFALALTAGGAPEIQAQAANVLEEVIVVAQRRDENLQDIPVHCRNPC